MLVLSRKMGERIVIGTGPDAVTITVVRIDANKVRIGIQAPRDVIVLRSELVPDGGPNKGGN